MKKLKDIVCNALLLMSFFSLVDAQYEHAPEYDTVGKTHSCPESGWQETLIKNNKIKDCFAWCNL